MAYHILCVDDDAEFLLSLKIQLKRDYQVTTAQNLAAALVILRQENVDLILLDIKLGSENGVTGLRQIKESSPDIDVVMVSGQRDPKQIVDAIRAGASDYLCKPFPHDELLAVIEKTKKLKSLRDRHDELVMDIKAKEIARPLVGGSKVFRDLLEKARCVRGHGANVLIEGESGTGKELLARYIHDLEGDGERPFIAVNCAAIPDTLIESELFGHEKGAFSGAFQRKIGKFELADDGDIFLDEINSLKPELQAKILRVIQERELYRVGGNEPVRLKFRVIAASNAGLETLVTEGRFRMDLYHRLRVVSFCIPALRERPEDIPDLIACFLKKHAVPGKSHEFSPDALESLVIYSWPGNARELENLVHSLVILAPREQIAAKDLPQWLFRQTAYPQTASPQTKEAPVERSEVVPLKHFVQRAETGYIRRVIGMNSGDKTLAAKTLGISRTSLYEKLKLLNLQ